MLMAFLEPVLARVFSHCSSPQTKDFKVFAYAWQGYQFLKVK